MGALKLLSSLDPDSAKWLVIAMAAATIAYAVVRPMFKKRDPMDSAPANSSLAQQRSVEREMSSLLLELSEMTRQLSAQLDTRSAKLEELMRQADRKIVELRSAGLLTPGGDSSLPPAAAPPTPPVGGANSPLADPSLAGLGLLPADARGVSTRPGLSNSANSPLFSDPGSRPQVDPAHAAIYAFVDEGLSLQEIAHRLGRPAGEVQLILNLRGRT